MSRRITGSRERCRCAADVTRPLVAIETGYSAGDDGVKPEVRDALHGAVQSQVTLPPNAALGAPHPGDAPEGAARGQLENASGQTGALTMIRQVSLELLDEVVDGWPARPELRPHAESPRGAAIRGTAAR